MTTPYVRVYAYMSTHASGVHHVHDTQQSDGYFNSCSIPAHDRVHMLVLLLVAHVSCDAAAPHVHGAKNSTSDSSCPMNVSNVLLFSSATSEADVRERSVNTTRERVRRIVQQCNQTEPAHVWIASDASTHTRVRHTSTW